MAQPQAGMAAAVVLMRRYRQKWCTSGLLRCTYRMHRVCHMQGGAGDVTRLSIDLTRGRAVSRLSRGRSRHEPISRDREGGSLANGAARRHGSGCRSDAPIPTKMVHQRSAAMRHMQGGAGA